MQMFSNSRRPDAPPIPVEPVRTPPVSQPVNRATTPARSGGMFSSGVAIKGSVKFKNELIIDGEVEGSIDSPGAPDDRKAGADQGRDQSEIGDGAWERSKGIFPRPNVANSRPAALCVVTSKRRDWSLMKTRPSSVAPRSRRRSRTDRWSRLIVFQIGQELSLQISAR